MENKHLRNNLLLLRDPSTASRSQPCSPLIDPTTRHGFSPLRGRKSFATESSRKSLYSNDDTLLRGRWPSSSSYSSSKQSSNSLADYLSNDSLPGHVDRKSSTNKSISARPQSLSRMRSCSEFSRFEEKKEEDEQKSSSSSRKISKENCPFGSSMRYIGKLRFPKSSSKTEINSRILPGRMSVDESILSNYRRTTDFAVDSLSSESDRSDNTKGMSPNIPRSRYKDSDPKSADRTPASKLAAAAGIRRSSSLTGKGPGLNLSPWALSPGHRSNSPPIRPPPAAAMDGGGTPTRSFSSLRPENPDKSKKVGNIISMGMDLFRRKQGSTSSNTKLRPSSPVMVVGDVGHKFRMLRNCLIQWRYVNARSNFTNQTRTSNAEGVLMSAWAEIGKLQSSVMKKTVQLEREKLHLKLNLHLSWQMKSLEGWQAIEKQHASALSTTQNCLQAAVCRLPLVDRAKADPQLLAIRLRQATNLIAFIESALGIYASVGQSAVPLLSELAQVVAEERTLSEECVEMLGLVSSLQIQEESLKCHLLQLNSSQLQSNNSLEGKFIFTN